MAANPFDQFDTPTASTQGANPFDQFDTPPVPQMQRGNLIDAVVEPILSMGSGLIAKPAGDIAGLVKGWHDTQRRWVGLGQWGPNAEETQQAVQHAIQYQPTTQVGASKWNPLNAIPAAIGGAIGLLQPDAVTGEQATTLGGAAQNAVREAIPQAIGIAGVKYGPGAADSVGQAAKSAAQATMVNAIKATPTEIMSGDAALAARELLKRGINPNTAGVVEINRLISDLHGQVESAISGSTANVSKQAVIDSLQRVKDSFMYKPNLPANQARIAAAGQELVDHPLLPADAIPVQTAQKLKRGYQQSVAEDYGVESTAGLEANKQIAQSLRKQIERMHPEVGPLNAEQGALLDALKVVQRRAAMAQNEGLVPHVSPLGGATAQAAMILNRNPRLRANLAQGLNKIGNLLSKAPEVDAGVVPFTHEPRVSGIQKQGTANEFVGINGAQPPSAPRSAVGLADNATGLDYGTFAKDFRAQKLSDLTQPDTLIARTQAANSERAAAQDWLQGELEKQRRKPTSGGMPFDLDPTTGRLRPADVGLRGATPATVEGAHGDLASAMQKLSGEGVQPPKTSTRWERRRTGTNADGSPKYIAVPRVGATISGEQSGKGFLLSADEKIALNNWVKMGDSEAQSIVNNFKESVPEWRTLSDSAIKGKISDRIQSLKNEYADWAAAAGERFRAEQAGKLNERASTPPVLTSKERATRKASLAEGQRSMDLKLRTRKAEMQAQIDALESMSEQLSAPRAGTLRDLGQGPKTRSVLRDLLTPQ